MTLEQFVLITGWGLFGLWFLLLVPCASVMIRRTLVRMSNGLPEPAAWPVVSMIIPARDEGANIEAALRSVLAIDYPNLEIIAIDDRSRDETGRVMDRLAAEDPRLRVTHVQTLPDGWLGKNHAMYAGANAAQGDYLLFTDGDILFSPDAIRRAVVYMRHHRADHLCALPDMLPGSYGENVLVSVFAFMFTAGTQPWLVSIPFKFFYVGAGAFNMVRRDAYQAIGGHVPLRLEVLDDVKLGKLIKNSGMRQRVVLARECVRVKWQDSAWGVIRGLEKNGFALMEYSLPRLILMSMLTVAASLAPYLGIFWLPEPAGMGHAATLLLLHGSYGILAYNASCGWNVFPALPLGVVGMLVASWRSAIITLRQGGVRWRDTFYPLDLLRENLYR